MTGWHFRIGYLSGDSYKGSKSQAWEHLRDAAQDLASNVSKVIPEAGAVNAARAAVYLRSAMTVEETANEVVITASGGGVWRLWKERTARAFTRTLMQRMHDADIDICVEVA
jgi:hypothetical protein